MLKIRVASFDVAPEAGVGPFLTTGSVSALARRPAAWGCTRTHRVPSAMHAPVSIQDHGRPIVAPRRLEGVRANKVAEGVDQRAPDT